MIIIFVQKLTKLFTSTVIKEKKEEIKISLLTKIQYREKQIIQNTILIKMYRTCRVYV